MFSVGRGEVGINSLSLDKNCMSYLSLLLGLESFKKFFLSNRKLLHQKMGQNFVRDPLVPSDAVYLHRRTTGDVSNFLHSGLL